MRLPTEVREMIYRYLLVASYTMREHNMKSKEVSLPLYDVGHLLRVQLHSSTTIVDTYCTAPTRLTSSPPQFFARIVGYTRKREICVNAKMTSFV